MASIDLGFVAEQCLGIGGVDLATDEVGSRAPVVISLLIDQITTRSIKVDLLQRRPAAGSPRGAGSARLQRVPCLGS